VVRDRVSFVDVLLRQEHPGERRGPYRSHEQKMESARVYKRHDGIPWLVLVDDLGGTTHKKLLRQRLPIYLIDATGRVALYTDLSDS
jgi:transposase